MGIAALFGLMAVGLLRYATSTYAGPAGWDVDLAYYAAMAAASMLCVLRAVLVPDQRAAWVLMSGVLVSDFVADLSWYYLELPYPSFADGIWLLSYLWMFGALVLLLRPLTGGWNRLLTIDWLIATLTASSLGVLLILPPVIDATTGASLESIVTLAYPVADILVLASLAVALVVGLGRPSLSLGLIVLAGAVWVVGDAVYSRQVAQGTYADGGLLDLLWPLAAGLIATAAWSPVATSRELPRAGIRAGWLSGACMILSLGVLLPPDSATENPMAFYLALAAIALGGLRLVLTQHENRDLLRAAHTDSLTGAGSRAKLASDLAGIEDRPTNVAVLDLDGFKFYNDSFGHPAGDILLRRISTRLTESLGDRGELYRIGGDEFCVLIPGTGVGSEISEELREATHLSGDGFEITASVGIASYPAEAGDLDAAIVLADERMYINKNGSRTSARSQVHEVLVRSIREREPELAEHTGRVRMLSLEIARRMGLDTEQIDVIERAAELHDVGKVAVPDSILLKEGPLEEDEWLLMKQHTIVGERIVGASPALAPVAALVRHSHESWDGSGYPDGLSGEEIPLGSRIILACDALDAMASQRPYSRAMTMEDALEEIRRNTGRQFDPAVVEVLLEIMDEAIEEAAADRAAST